jgi:hypothetical protein
MSKELWNFLDVGWKKLNPEAAADFLERFERALNACMQGTSPIREHPLGKVVISEAPNKPVQKKILNLMNRRWDLLDEGLSLLDIQGEAMDRRYSIAEDKYRAFLDRQGQFFGRLEKQHPRSWELYRDLEGTTSFWCGLGYRAYLDGWACAGVAEKGIAALEAGLIPLDWRGGMKNGTMVCMRPPMMKPVKRIDREAVARPSLGRQARKGSPVEQAGWNDLLKIPAGAAAKKLLTAFVGSSQPEAAKLVRGISERVVGISVRKGDREIEMTVDRAPFSKKLRVFLGAPWTGSVKGLPKELATAITTCNGIRLSIGGAGWFKYKDAGGFAFDWAVWREMSERGKEIVEKPLVPFGDGDDIWCYAPSTLGGPSPRLARVCHETGELESAKRVNPALLFLRMIQKAIVE